MPLRDADQRFIRNLQVLDHLLDCRWSDLLSSWVIDRKGVVPESEVRFLIRRLARAEEWLKAAPGDKKKRDHRDGVAEELRSARAGRRVIFFTRNLDRTTFDRLALGDIRRYGGYSRLADEIEAEERAAAKSRDRSHAGELEDVNREAFDQLNFILDKKDARLHAGVRDLKTLLHGR